MLGVGLTDVYCSATLAGCPLPRKECFTISGYYTDRGEEEAKICTQSEL